MRTVLLTLLLWAALGGAAEAQKTGFKCTFEGAKDRDWIQPLIFFGLDRAIDRVVVSDPAILGLNGGVPLEGRLVQDNAARVTFAWSLETRSASNQRVRMDYRATYLKASGKVNVTARPLGLEGVYNRAGTCIVQDLSP
ncbi:hypothetical protein [Maliponia aquimaris]|uniref:Uncharacterized protein n=1 Tax=Maliponia aquimaris TaxID=1673631 RepID=A0A238K2V0_9RHOB|nr:hypothetical protein [Maliponia aquimaris]SMX36787.1 hypothetical protein MAA8898_01044 [Maliponia aquimaris]